MSVRWEAMPQAVAHRLDLLCDAPVLVAVLGLDVFQNTDAQRQLTMLFRLREPLEERHLERFALKPNPVEPMFPLRGHEENLFLVSKRVYICAPLVQQEPALTGLLVCSEERGFAVFLILRVGRIAQQNRAAHRQMMRVRRVAFADEFAVWPICKFPNEAQVEAVGLVGIGLEHVLHVPFCAGGVLVLDPLHVVWTKFRRENELTLNYIRP